MIPDHRSARALTLGALMLIAVLTIAGCGAPSVRELVAFSDEVAQSCGDLATRMTEGWLAAERNGRRQMSWAEADLAHFDYGRDRCRAALELLEELVAESGPPPSGAEPSLSALLALNRLVLRSIADPDMDSVIFEATVQQVRGSYRRIRLRLTPLVGLDAKEQQRLVGLLLPRWEAKMAEGAGGG
jgi:hypothetical protein